MVDGEKVRRWRLAQAINQGELAEKAGTTRAAISQIETGKRQPYPSTIRRLADALGVEPRALLKGDDS